MDTLRADHLPIYGYRGGATPSLDALRRDAVLFENAYTHVPLTLPSHVSLLTGLLPPASGVRDNYGYTLSPGVETLEALLQKAHYATGAAVSSAVLSHETGLNQGFEFYDDSVEAGPREERDGALSARALSGWLEGHRRQPFFAFLHLNEPHSPYDPPEPYRSRYRSTPTTGRSPGPTRSSGRSSTGFANGGCTSARSSSSFPTTERGSRTTGSGSTASSCIASRSTSRSW